MFEQDYVMRLIKEMVRFLVKLIFSVDTEHPMEQLLERETIREKWKELLALVEAGDDDCISWRGRRGRGRPVEAVPVEANGMLWR